MPKVKLNTIAVSEASIKKEIQELEALLEGRLDTDNFVSTASGSASLGKASFSDYADFGAPIYADKFFGTDQSVDNVEYQPDFYDDVFIDLLNKNHNANTYAIMTQKGTITLNYKNQVNLEKPQIIAAAGGLTLEEQQKATQKFIEDRRIAQERYLAEQEANRKYANPFVALGLFLVGASLGAIAGPFGAIAGAALAPLAYTGSVALTNYLDSRFQFDYSYDAHKANQQMIIFRHPPNYRIVSMLEVIDRLNDLFKADGTTPENIRYFSDYSESTRYDESKLPAVATRISVESKIDKDIGLFYTVIGMPFVIDAEMTGVRFEIIPKYPGTELIESDDEYITALIEVDILFKEIT